MYLLNKKDHNNFIFNFVLILVSELFETYNIENEEIVILILITDENICINYFSFIFLNLGIKQHFMNIL